MHKINDTVSRTDPRHSRFLLQLFCARHRSITMTNDNKYYLDALNHYYPAPVMPTIASASIDSDCCSVKTDGCSIKTEGCSTKTNHSGSVAKARGAKKCHHLRVSHDFVEGLGLELELDGEARQDCEVDARIKDDEEDACRHSPITRCNKPNIIQRNEKDDVYSTATEHDVEGADFMHQPRLEGEQPSVGSIKEKKKRKKQRNRISATLPTATTTTTVATATIAIGKTRKQQQGQKGTKTSYFVAEKCRTPVAASSLSPNDAGSFVTGPGRIVGLRLPSDVAPDFDVKNKPAKYRRVNPKIFLALMEESKTTTATTTTANWTTAASRHEINDRRMLAMHEAKSTIPRAKSTTALLDVYLPAAHYPGTRKKDKKKIIRMVRNPNEPVSATIRRLNMSVQKNVGDFGGGGGSGGTATEIRGADAKSKSKKAGKQPRCSIKAVLLKRKEKCGSADPPMTTSFEENEELACTTFWDRFYDKLPPSINCACNPWNNEDDSPSYSLDVENMIGSTVAAGGYECVEIDHFKSLSIDEMLHRAASRTETDLDRYVLAFPVSFRFGKKGHRATKQQQMHFILDSCPPTITSVTSFGSFEDSHLFERTPIVIEVKSIHATDVQIAWFANSDLVCANSSWYAPNASDVGKLVTVVIIPKRHDHNGNDRAEAYQFARCVEALPLLPIIRPLREEFVPRGHEEKDGPSSFLRILTYNILADQNASRDVNKDDAADRSYSHCKNEHIIKWRRFPLIVHEILEHEPDIIALQEVDTDVFANLLRPVLFSQGYEGYFSQKGVDETSGIREGCAIFWSLNVFESVRPVDMQTHTFRDMIRQFICEDRVHKSQWKSLGDVSDLLDKHDHLRHVLFEKLGHVLQTVVLTRRMKKEKVVVGNTHLFYHPMASHIRCLKMLMTCRQLEIEHRENEQCPIILCGDLNSHPKSGLMKLLLDRYLDARNGMTWKHLCTYEWEEGAGGVLAGAHPYHDVRAIDLELPSSFPKFISAYPTPPDFTHFVEAYAGTLDYILMTENFEVIKSGPTPTREDVQKFVAMPNQCMPSDHVSLVCDVKWR